MTVKGNRYPRRNKKRYTKKQMSGGGWFSRTKQETSGSEMVNDYLGPKPASIPTARKDSQ